MGRHSGIVANHIQIIKNIIWQKILCKPIEEEEDVFSEGWTLVTPENFSSLFNHNFPLQTKGVDCGVFVTLYAWYLINHKQFEFTVHDMNHLRKWLLLSLVESCNKLQLKQYLDAFDYRQSIIWTFPESIFSDLFSNASGLTTQSTTIQHGFPSSQQATSQNDDVALLSSLHKDSGIALEWYKKNKNIFKHKSYEPIILSKMDEEKESMKLKILEILQCEFISDDDHEELLEALGFEFDDIEDLKLFLQKMRDEKQLKVFAWKRDNI